MVANQAIIVGSKVCFTIGTSRHRGVVVDDRGPIGANNIRIFKIRIPNDPYDDEIIEMPWDEIELAGDETKAAIPNEAVVEFLKSGGLRSILMLNMSDGKNQPRAWLRTDSLDNVIHTLIEERGRIGGSTIPYRAMRADRVFLPELDAVLKFLRSFGLSQDAAEDIVKSVGTSE